MRKYSFKAGGLFLLLMAASAFAVRTQGAVYTNNFSADPLLTGEASLTGSAKWVASGGVGGSGYISITDAVGSQQGVMVFPDFTQQAIVGGFVAEFKVRIGGGTARPADGMAFVFAPEVDDFSNFSEEGLGTGLIVSFDTYDNGGADTAPAIDIKVGGTGDANIVSTTFLGGVREGNRARPGPVFTDPVTGQEVALGTGNEFAPLRIEVRDGVLNVFYKGYHIVRNVVTPFAAVPGRFAFGARTGGAWDNHWVDDVRIETFDVTAPGVTEFAGSAGGFRARLQDAPTSTLNLNSITARLNGAPINVASNKVGDVTTIGYVAATPLASGSSNEVVLAYTHGTTGQRATNTFSFLVAPYQTLPASFAVPASQVNTANPGFSVTTVQARSDAGLGTDNATAENLIRGLLIDATTGLPYVNHASPATSVDPDVINWSQDSGLALEAGNFRDPDKPDEPIPGIPGDEFSTDNIAAELITYLQLPAGVTRFGVNSDDGFRVTSGQNPRDILAPELGTFNGGRGSSDTLFDVNVPTAGIYPIRLLWYEGGGGANLEFFTVDTLTGAKTLVNDLANANSIRAYASANTSVPYVNRVSPADNATGLFPDASLEATIVGLAAGGNVTATLNGAAVTPTVTTQGTNTIVRATPPALLAAGSTNTYTLTFGGVTDTVRFVVANYTTIPSGLAVPLTAGDTNAAGFRAKIVQARSDSGLENTAARAEAQLAGTLIDPLTSQPFVNEATPGPGPNGTYVDTDVINWNQDAGVTEAGSFQAPNHPDEPIPGIPGSGFHTDNLAAEIFAYVPLKAGLNKLGVNSDDGFRVTVATDANTNAPTLGLFEGGRGVADTTFAFVAPTAGLYPLRLVWYEGTGGAAVEFFMLDDAGQKILLNDPANAASPQVYYNVTGGTTPAFTSVTRSGGNIVVSWSGTATLQSADAITGPWSNVAGATSPYSTPTSGGAKFFRLAQ